MHKKIGGLLALLLLVLMLPSIAQAQTPVVQAVLFFSPACSHCEKVIEQELPPLQRRYGARLQVLQVNITTPVGRALFNAAQTQYSPPPRGVPTLIVGSDLLVGSADIPAQFPDLVEYYLAAGGVGWPALPGMEEAITEFESSLAAPASSWLQGPAVVILGVVALVGLLGGAIALTQSPSRRRKPASRARRRTR